MWGPLFPNNPWLWCLWQVAYSVQIAVLIMYKHTALQDTFGCNMLALNGGRPEQLTLRDFLTYFISFREEVVARRTAFELRIRITGLQLAHQTGSQDVAGGLSGDYADADRLRHG